MITQAVAYQDGNTALEGFVAYQDNGQAKPVVLVVHDWSGCNAFAKQKAEQLAKCGFVGFAVDVYGKGVLGETKEEKSALIEPFLADRGKLQRRLQAAIEKAKQLPEANNQMIAAIGFCFGGLCVLDLARCGADIKGVVSVHGLFMPADNLSDVHIKSKVLALHGYDDPMATPEQLIAFANEMTKAKADWQIHSFGQTLHAFTNPEANDPAFGTVYNPTADKRSWQLIQQFLQEIF